MRLILRRLRGALGTALVWATAWFGAGVLFITINQVLQLLPFRLYAQFFWSNALTYGAQMAAVGFLTGGAFSMYVTATFRDKGVQELSPGRFALGGGLIAVLLSLVSLAVAPGLDVLLLGDLVVPLVMAGFLGGGTGYASIKLARRALPASEAEVDELSSGSDSLLPDRGRAV